ncbi:MAG: radical SAM protein, partial [Planctomycetes bacterium]|nr:radical SAM protein [Planctomycetota bacterium]
MSKITDAMLKHVKIVSTQVAPTVTETRVTGPLGVKLLQMTTRVVDGQKIACDLEGPAKAQVQPMVDRFLSVINRVKVIGNVEGRLVYNLYNPPMPSPAALRPFERKLRSHSLGYVLPATATLSITPNCPCKCVHCSADRFVTKEGQMLSTEELASVVDQTLALGVCTLIFTGGEPMARKDLYDQIARVDKNLAHVMIFTCGAFLNAESVARLKEAGLGSMNVSIDSDRPEEHDQFRNRPGTFKQAVEGARMAREAGIMVGVSTYATHENLTNGRLEHLLEIARDEGFHEVTIFDCVPTGKFLRRDDLILGRKDIEAVRALADKYNSDTAEFGVTAQAKANAPDGGGCFGSFSQFYMTCYGDIDPCDFNPVSFGNVRNAPLAEIWKKMVTHPEFCGHRMSCRMQSQRYRRKYIDPLTDDEVLPVLIDRLP